MEAVMGNVVVGNSYGKLRVIDFSPTRNGHSYWVCKCECGNEKVVMGANLKRGLSRICGCMRSENKGKFVHGLTYHPLHAIWSGIKSRCGDAQRHNGVYANIRICKEWASDFVKFYDWSIANGWEKGLQIDRIDNKGDYTPENCRWVTQLVNSNNKSTNRFITINGVTKTLAEWARYSGKKPITIAYRLKQGYSPVDAVNLPINFNR